MSLDKRKPIWEAQTRGEILVGNYMEATGVESPGEPEVLREAITDILTDLHHYCLSVGIDLNSSLEMSARHFKEEHEESLR